MTIRVLLVDDDLRVIATLTRVLSLKRDIAIVGEAANGLDAVDLAVSTAADVIVMDQRMPLMNGLDATRRIRDAGVEAPVLMFTANDVIDLENDVIPDVHVLSKSGEGFRRIGDEIRRLARPAR